jgi:hypothetical protein
LHRDYVEAGDGRQPHAHEVLMPIYRQTATKLAEVKRSSAAHQWSREEQVELDGVIYDICVAKHGSDFLAVSVCNECCEQVSINLGSSSPKKARDRAVVGLQLHHDSVHRLPRKPR